MVELSVIIPVYCNQETLAPVLAEFESALSGDLPAPAHEIVFVDDGSPDGSLAVLRQLAREHANVKVVKLTRNFGQVPAIHAGLAHASGRFAATCSADGQDPPSLILEMYQKACAEDLPIVIGTRQTRDEPLSTRVVSLLFSLVMRRLALRNYPVGGFDCLLLSRRCYRELTARPEKSPFLQGQVLWLGHRVGQVPYRRRSRLAGRSKWTIGKKLAYLWDGLVGYSFAPIQAMTVLGFLSAAAALLYAVVVLVARLVYHSIPIGWAPLMIVILLVSGIQMMMLGVIGQYLRRTYDEARPRALYLVDEVIAGGAGGGSCPEAE